jgi:hypothetical protein
MDITGISECNIWGDFIRAVSLLNPCNVGLKAYKSDHDKDNSIQARIHLINILLISKTPVTFLALIVPGSDHNALPHVLHNGFICFKDF